MGAYDKLKEYWKKRDFLRTSEPKGAVQPARHPSRRYPPRFVVQQHDASKMHFDFRLEVEGVLKSWAVPKGPSVHPGDKRLAVRTQDHPIEYLDFEGVIPQGEYGAGSVLVWDAGTFENQTRSGRREVPAPEALRKGHLAFLLQGRKLKGGFALTRISESRKDERWLLVKQRDEEAAPRRNPVSTQPESVLSERTLAEVRDERPGNSRGAPE